MKAINDREEKVVYSTYITTKSGRKIYAWQKGLKAFRFVVKKRK